MKHHLLLSVAMILVLLTALWPTPARADGIIIPEPPICEPGRCPPVPCPPPLPCPPPSPMVQLVIRYHRVTVEIQDQIAVTRVDQVFYNPNAWPVEGTYLFPIPPEAAVSAFSLWVDGEPVSAEMLPAEQAQQKYITIVNSLRDPALLEYAGSGAVQARLFPIPAGGERRIELEYTQVLTAKDGLVRYVYPLGTEKYSAWPLEQVVINVDIRSSLPIRAVYSPTHAISLNRQSTSHVQASYEASQTLPSADFALYYSQGEEPALHLLSYRDMTDRSDPDGYFVLLLAPRPNPSEQPAAKDILLVLDRSGSMEGEKFQQAKAALRAVLEHLNPTDRFNVITFSSAVESFAAELQPATQAAEALRWIEQSGAAGSTDIHGALLKAAAMASAGRPTYLIFLTDGLPTQGVVDSAQILRDFAAAAPAQLRLFAFGVGYDVDTFLLDSLAQEHHGLSFYVQPGEALDQAVANFYTRISAPALTDPQVDFGAIEVYDLYPSPLPDLFRGAQVTLVGRYRNAGAGTLTLTGQVDGTPQRFQAEAFFSAQPPAQPDRALSAIPRLWATRKIGYLLNQIRLHGPDPETIQQIVRLSIRFGILTPYTSYLVTEADPLGAAAQERIAGEQFNLMQGAPAAVSGPEAVQKAATQGSIAAAEAPAEAESAALQRVRQVGARTFLWQQGKWVDTAFDPATMTPIPLPFLSPAYFALAGRSPEAAAALALGPTVIFFAEGQAYEVVPADSVSPAVSPSPTSQPTQPQLPSIPSHTPPSAAPSSYLPCAGSLLPLALFLVLKAKRF